MGATSAGHHHTAAYPPAPCRPLNPSKHHPPDCIQQWPSSACAEEDPCMWCRQSGTMKEQLPQLCCTTTIPASHSHPPLPPNPHPLFLGVSDDPPVSCSRLEPWREASLSAAPSAAARPTLRGLRGGRCLVPRAPRLLRRDLQMARTVLIMASSRQHCLACLLRRPVAPARP